MKRFSVILLMVFVLTTLSFAQGKIGLHVGYWSPSLDEFNDGLRDLGATERFSGNVQFGADYIHPLNKQWDLKVEGFYWAQTITEDGGGEASVSIIPILVSGLYKIETTNSKLAPYVGGGIGLGFVSWEISGGGDSVDDTANPFMFQLLGGVDYHTSDSMFLFAEAAYVIGSFNAKIADLTFNEDVSMNGFSIKGGVRFVLK